MHGGVPMGYINTRRRIANAGLPRCAVQPRPLASWVDSSCGKDPGVVDLTCHEGCKSGSFVAVASSAVDWHLVRGDQEIHLTNKMLTTSSVPSPPYTVDRILGQCGSEHVEELAPHDCVCSDILEGAARVSSARRCRSASPNADTHTTS